MNEFTTTDKRFKMFYDNPRREISTRFDDGKGPVLAELYPNLAAMIDEQFDDDVTAASLEIDELTSVIEGFGFDRETAHAITADTLTALA